MTRIRIKNFNLKFTKTVKNFLILTLVFVQIFMTGLFVFSRPVLASSGSIWLQTSQTDFETGILTNVDTASTPGDLKLAIKSDWF